MIVNDLKVTALIAACICSATACGVKKETTLAPTDSYLALRAEATYLAANTSTSLTIEFKRLDGTPAPDGTEVVLQASAGELDQQKIRTRGGQATATYRAGTAAGTVRITASSGALSAELSLRVGSAAPGSLSLFLTPLSLPPGGGEVEILAIVSASNGALVAGAPVAFGTTTGTFSSSEVTTNDRGEARTTLRTSTTATVRAAVLGLESSTVLKVKAETLVRVATAPADPIVGESATVSVSVTSAGAPASGKVRVYLGDGQARDMVGFAGSATTSYTWTQEGGYDLSAEFSDADGFITRETVRVTVKAKAPAPTPTPTPNPPSRGGDELDPSKLTWLHTDVSGWPITSTITDVTVTASEICVDHTGAGRFPTSPFGTITVEGNVWVFAQFNGRWYAATYDWLRPGQVCKGVTGPELGPDQIRIAPMDASWPGPRSGETVGFMVSTRARDSVSAGEERTNIVLVKWP